MSRNNNRRVSTNVNVNVESDHRNEMTNRNNNHHQNHFHYNKNERHRNSEGNGSVSANGKINRRSSSVRCLFFAQGNCANGDTCRYSHDIHSTPNPHRPARRSLNTKRRTSKPSPDGNYKNRTMDSRKPLNNGLPVNRPRKPMRKVVVVNDSNVFRKAIGNLKDTGDSSEIAQVTSMMKSSSFALSGPGDFEAPLKNDAQKSSEIGQLTASIQNTHLSQANVVLSPEKTLTPDNVTPTKNALEVVPMNREELRGMVITIMSVF
eukprot:TRINITY_DN3192_c0_g1_i5.p1 TRINITY_DN3192_c0_g1~~TRINITY_DN3192_c0_g1_i5.p1  ORF type:complete len:276 (-),score=3.77 TRINITY_DN3192_c0_g1_i5:180-968(-)